MDFALLIDNRTGLAAMTFTKATTLMNNVFLSLMVKRGSFLRILLRISAAPPPAGQEHRDDEAPGRGLRAGSAAMDGWTRGSRGRRGLGRAGPNGEPVPDEAPGGSDAGNGEDPVAFSNLCERVLGSHAFEKDFDELFAAILRDWQNQFPEADLSRGSLIYLKSACLASALWGLYKYQDWIARQIFRTRPRRRKWSTTPGSGGSPARPADGRGTPDPAPGLHRRPPGGAISTTTSSGRWRSTASRRPGASLWPKGGYRDVVITADATATGRDPSGHTMTGTATSLTESKMVDSAADFTASGDPSGSATSSSMTTWLRRRR
jgi:hypothetical protein